MPDFVTTPGSRWLVRTVTQNEPCTNRICDFQIQAGTILVFQQTLTCCGGNHHVFTIEGTRIEVMLWDFMANQNLTSIS